MSAAGYFGAPTAVAAAALLAFIYGPGIDGSTTLDGTTGSKLGMSLSSTNNYTLNRDVYYADLTINTGVTVNTAGFRIFVNGTLTLNGTISRNGTNGAALANQTLGASAAGGAAGSAANGSSGGNTTSAGGGNGGAGGISGGGLTGGAAGTATVLIPGGTYSGLDQFSILPGLTTLVLQASNSRLAGGAGGGGGAAPSGSTASQGASGGGVVGVYARLLTGSGRIEAKGGTSDAATGTNAGTGGGGGGGYIHLVTSSAVTTTLAALGPTATVGSITLDVSPGSGGNPVGTGVRGADGVAGRYSVIKLAA